MSCGPPGSSVHGASPGKNTRVGCHALLQKIFPTQGWNPGLLHCTQILYRLSHQQSPTLNRIESCKICVLTQIPGHIPEPSSHFPSWCPPAQSNPRFLVGFAWESPERTLAPSTLSQASSCLSGWLNAEL